VSPADDRAAEIRQLLAHGAHHLIADRGDVRWLLAERDRLAKRVEALRAGHVDVVKACPLAASEASDIAWSALKVDDEAAR
jgi:hypothetical protein